MAIVIDFPSCVGQDVWQLRCLAFECGNTAALNAVVRSFVGGTFAHVIKTCHEAFESGTDLDDDMVNMMRHVFEARLALMSSIPSCPYTGKIPSDQESSLEEDYPEHLADMAFLRMICDLRYADENLSEFTSALFVLDDDSYDDIVWDEQWKVNGNEWFCARNRVEQQIPRGLIEFLLSDLNSRERLGE